MNFDDALAYLLSLGNEVAAMKLGLKNITILLGELGDACRDIKKVQVAGTNGKGSVCAFVESICLSAGVHTGLYTSPHLESITERIRIDGHDISREDFARIATHVRETAEHSVHTGKLASTPTFFEQITAIALVAFQSNSVDLAILETGLGGRLDATTAARAEIAAITRIDLDHQNYLGETLQEIAAEKAAVIHAGSRVVIGEQQPLAADVILERCRSFGIDPLLAADVATNVNGDRIHFVTGKAEYQVGRLGLEGRHQIENAKAAILVAELLQSDLQINADDIIDGLTSARNPGRLEFAGRFLFDGAHNPGGARALRDYLDEFVNRPITMIFAAMDDKNVAEMASVLFPKADTIVLSRPENVRALSLVQLANVVPAGFPPDRVFLTNSVSDALEKAVELTSQDGLILITGSLYLIGEAKGIIKANF